MNKLITLFLVAALSACATPDAMRKEAPMLELTSSRSSKVVAMCIADRWENAAFGADPVNFRPTSDGYTMNCCLGMAVADVTDVLNGSKTRFFADWRFKGSYDEMVKECQ